MMRQVHANASNVTIEFSTQSSNSESDVIFPFVYCEQANDVITLCVPVYTSFFYGTICLKVLFRSNLCFVQIAEILFHPFYS